MNKKYLIGILIVILIIVCIFIFININKGNEENNFNNANTTQTDNSNSLSEENTNNINEEFVQTLDNGVRVNTSDKLHETKSIDGLEISDFTLTQRDNTTLLLGTIKNVSSSTKGGYPIDIKVIDKDNQELITISGYINELAPGETSQLNVSTTLDYVNAYDFEITKK